MTPILRGHASRIGLRKPTRQAPVRWAVGVTFDEATAGVDKLVEFAGKMALKLEPWQRVSLFRLYRDRP